MKIRSVVALQAWTISFALPIFFLPHLPNVGASPY